MKMKKPSGSMSRIKMEPSSGHDFVSAIQCSKGMTMTMKYLLLISICLLMPLQSFAFVTYPYMHANTIATLAVSTTTTGHRCTSSLLLNSKTNNTDLSSSSLSSEKLTDQERILQETLGIQPETEAEKQIRIKKRDAALESTQNSKRKNAFIAILAFTAAILNYGYQFTHPITSLTLLTQMQNNSAELNVIGNNGKPTVVDFWASWCENCKAAAPTLMSIEEEYKDRVNFVMVNGDKGENWPIIERFGVDAIPHMAMVGSDGVIETALIGPIPRSVMKDDLNAMLDNAEKRQGGSEGKMILPHTMYDAFRSKPEMRQLNFSADEIAIRLGQKD
jgi:thiol-disulfide isomerase/thioredoxin